MFCTSTTSQLLCKSGRQLKRQLRALTMATEDTSYNHAVDTLNSLQTNAAVLEEAGRSTHRERRSRELIHMVRFLERAGMETSDLDRLRAIHVTGTKGKGSVCAMTERILRAHGLNTGFYSSPHLREVRERIRLNGRPLTKEHFVESFWEVYNRLDGNKDQFDGTMPPYFRFLTLMAFNVFLKEKVDVAVVEVGIGGTFDSTNIIPNPVVCGIASLGLDHVELLGDTLEKIAWQKGGICKASHPVFTVPQESSPLRVLQERASELKALPLEVVPELMSYPCEQPVLALAGDHQKVNASLAVQLCRSWLQTAGKWTTVGGEQQTCPPRDRQLLHGVPVAESFPLPPQFYEGLRECRWPGRNQVFHKEGVSYYIDGAHTPQSIETSVQWFLEASAKEAKSIRGDVARVLVFNLTGRRKPDIFLQPLLDCGFDYAVFCPNITGIEGANSPDQTNLTVTKDKVLDSVRENERMWRELMTKQRTGKLKHLTNGHVTNGDMLVDHVTGHVTNGAVMCEDTQTKVFSNLRDVVEWLERNDDSSSQVEWNGHSPSSLRLRDASHVQVLVTGSLHLAGVFMSVLDVNVDDC